MSEPLIRHFALLRKATMRYKDAMCSALSRNLLDQKLFTIKLNMEAALNHLSDFAKALSLDDGQPPIVDHLGAKVKLSPTDAGSET